MRWCAEIGSSLGGRPWKDVHVSEDVSFDLFVFDLDGTVVDSLPDITRALNLGLAELGRAPLPAETVKTLVGEGVVRLAEKALDVAQEAAGGERRGVVSAERLAEHVRRIYEVAPCLLTQLYPGMRETLDALANQGKHLALVTNKPGIVMRPLLVALGLADVFHVSIGDGDGYPRKPDPAALVALMSRFGVAADRTVMVGDGLPDMEAARRAGCPAAAALWGYTPSADLLATRPAFVLTDCRELIGVAG